VVRCVCARGLDGTKGGTVVDLVRLFPLRPGVRWTYRVHEQILPSLKIAPAAGNSLSQCPSLVSFEPWLG
jgi:hypothetical protein